MKPEKTITIMADFGFGPYAWLKDASDESEHVGENIANFKTGIELKSSRTQYISLTASKE